MLGRPPRDRGSLQLRSLPIWAPDLWGRSPAPDIDCKSRGNTHQRQSHLAEPSQPVGPPLLTLEDSGCFEPVGLGVICSTVVGNQTISQAGQAGVEAVGGHISGEEQVGNLFQLLWCSRGDGEQPAGGAGGARERGRWRESSRQRKSGVITWWQGKTLHHSVFHLHSPRSLYYVIFHSPWSGWMKGLQKNSSQKEIDLKVRTSEVREHSRLHSVKRRSAPSFAHLPNRLSERPAYWASSVGCDMPAFRGPQVSALRYSSHYFQDETAGEKKRPHCLSWKGSVGICISSAGSHWSQATKAKQTMAQWGSPTWTGWVKAEVMAGCRIMRQGPGRDKEWGSIVGNPWIRIQ